MVEDNTPQTAGYLTPEQIREFVNPTFYYVRNQFLATKEQVIRRGAIVGWFDDNCDLEICEYAYPEEIEDLARTTDNLPGSDIILNAIEQYDFSREYVVVFFMRLGVYTNGEYGQFVSFVSKTGYGGIS
jgi:hypothetical protein